MPSHRWRVAPLGASLVVAIALLATLVIPVASGPERAGHDELLPDLAIAPLEDITVETDADGRRLLRFSATILNLGAGPLEVRGLRDGPDQASMRVEQLVHGLTELRRRATRGTMTYAGDGHDHWHVHDVMRYEVRADRDAARVSEKTGFCFWDNRRHDLSLDGAPEDPAYAASLCGDLRSIGNRMGLSVGWGDRYRSTLAFQWVEITGLPDGRYTLVAEADPDRLFLEEDRSNNCAALTIDLEGSTVAVVAVVDEAHACPRPPPVPPVCQTSGHATTAGTPGGPAARCPRLV